LKIYFPLLLINIYKKTISEILKVHHHTRGFVMFFACIYTRTVHSTHKIWFLFWSAHKIVDTILPEIPVGKFDILLSEWWPTANGQGSGQQPPAWSTHKSSTVGLKGIPLKLIL